MSPKRGDEVPQPRVGEEWEIRFDASEAVQGWKELVNAAPNNARWAWEIMRSAPGPGPSRSRTADTSS